MLDTFTNRIKQSFQQVHNDVVNDAVLIGDNSFISVSSDRQAKFFDIKANKIVLNLPCFSSVSSICATDNPDVFVIGYADGNLRIVDIRTKKATTKISAHPKSRVLSVGFNSISGSVLSVGKNSEYVETNLQTSCQVWPFKDSKFVIDDEAVKLSVHPESSVACCGSNNGLCFLFLTGTQKPITLSGGHQSPVICSTFASNILLTGDSRCILSFWK
jgi:WD40 repeat protein